MLMNFDTFLPFFFIFKHSRALKRSWKIFHGVLESPGKVLHFFVSKRVGTLAADTATDTGNIANSQRWSRVELMWFCLSVLMAIFPTEPGLASTSMFPFWILLELSLTKLVVTTGTIRRAKLQSYCHQQTMTHFLQARCHSCHPTNSVIAEIFQVLDLDWMQCGIL